MSTSLQNTVINSSPSNSTMTNSLAPQDVLKNVERQISDSKERERIIMEKSRQAEREKNLLQKIVYDNANPSPVFVVCVAFGVIVALYVIYLLFLKPSACGEWRDASGNKWELNHNLLSGRIKVRINDFCAGAGQITDNFVRYGDLVGVWDYANEIAFTEGWSIYRLL
jgi:hypothetical protein